MGGEERRGEERGKREKGEDRGKRKGRSEGEVSGK